MLLQGASRGRPKGSAEGISQLAEEGVQSIARRERPVREPGGHANGSAIDPLIDCLPGGPNAETSVAFNGLAVEAHDVVCDRFLPTANGGPNRTVALGGNPMVTVLLNGAASGGGDSGIVSYDWTCGNGTPLVSGLSVSCDYTAAATYVVLLTVTNGCAVIDTDTVTITVNP